MPNNDSDLEARNSPLYDPDDAPRSGSGSNDSDGDVDAPDSDKQHDEKSDSSEGLSEKEASDSSTAPDSSSKAANDEKNALGGFVKGGLGQFANSNSGAGNALNVKKKAKMYVAGILAAFVAVIILVLFTFNVPAATIRAAGNGLTATYFGAQIMQGKLHFTKYWNGKIADGYYQSCVAGDCEIQQKTRKTLLERLGIRSANQDIKLLNEKGISLMSENGKFVGLKIDAMKESSPYYDAVNEKAIQEDFQRRTGLKNITVERIVGQGDTFTVKTGSTFTGFRNNTLVASVMDNAGHKNIYSRWSSVRQMGGILGLGFKPLTTLRSKAADKVNSAADKWVQSLIDKISRRGTLEPTARVGINDTEDPSKTTSSESGKLSYDNLKSAAQKISETKTVKGAGAGMMIVGGVCVMSSVLNGVDAIKIQNFDRPAGAFGASIMAASDQVSAVSDPQVDSEGAEAMITKILETKDKDGKTVSFADSAAWKNQNGIGGGKQMAAVHAVPAGISNSETTELTTLGAIADLIKSAQPICGNEFTTAILAGGGLALMVLSGPFGILEGLVVSAIFAMAIDDAVSFMAGSPLDVAELIKDPAEAYNVASAGVKNNADTIAFTHGGDPQSSTDFNNNRKSYYAELEQEFQSQSIAYRLFNMNDPLSPANTLATTSSKYMSTNVARITSAFVNILPAIGRSMGTLFMPKAQAADSYDPCTESRYGCTGLSEKVINDDASRAIAFLGTNPSVDSAPLKYMRDCRDNDFYFDEQLGSWTYKVVESLTADGLRKINQLPSECTSSSNMNDPLINSLKAYVSLEPMLSGKVCHDASDSSADDLDKTACQKVGYGTPATPEQATTTDPTTSIPSTPLPNKDGWVWPVPGKTRISFSYGKEGCGATCGTHKGIDIPGPIGTPVVAAHDGTIVATSGGCQGTYLIKATGTNVYFAYQHLSKPLPKGVGATVTAGEKIGTLGPIGNCGTGPHLHFSIELTQHVSIYRDSLSLSADPMGYLPKP